MPATKSVVYIRNYTADDNTQRTIQGNTYVSASDASFAVPSGMEFVSWNTSRDGTGTAYVVGAAVVATTVYAIWESIPDPIPYITTDTELTSVANAIRTKGGTSAQLVYPTGFVSAIEAIPTGGGGYVTADSCVSITLFNGAIVDDIILGSTIALMPTDEAFSYIIEDTVAMNYMYSAPVGWLFLICDSVFTELTIENPVSLTGEETLTAYKFNFDTQETEELPIEFTWGDIFNVDSWYFTVPAISQDYGLYICINFGS